MATLKHTSGQCFPNSRGDGIRFFLSKYLQNSCFIFHSVTGHRQKIVEEHYIKDDLAVVNEGHRLVVW